MGKGVEKREKEILRHIGGNVDVLSIMGKQYGGFSKNYK